MSKKKSKMPEVAQPHPDNDYETKSHLSTLMDAELIKGDHDKMKKVHALAGRHHKALQGIRSTKKESLAKQLRDTYNDKFGHGKMDDHETSDHDEDDKV